MIKAAIERLMNAGTAKLVTSPEPDHVYWLHNPWDGKLSKHERQPAVLNVEVFTLPGLRDIDDAFAGAGSTVFVGGGEILLSLDEGVSRRPTAVMTLPYTPQFKEFRAIPVPRGHKAFMQWITTKLPGVIGTADVNLLTNLKLSKIVDAESGSAGPGQESIGRKTLGVVTARGGDPLPVSLDATFSIYDKFPDITFTIQCLLVVDYYGDGEKPPTLCLVPHAGSLIAAVQYADRKIFAFVRDIMPARVYVLEGKRLR